MIDIDLENIESFQRYAGRKMQRFNPDTHYGLGWMSFPTYICIKKVMFLLTLTDTDKSNILQKLSKERDFNENIKINLNNVYRSSLYEF